MKTFIAVVLVVSACGVGQLTPAPASMDAGSTQPEWSCPTCRGPIGSYCLGECGKLEGEETVCTGQYSDELGGMCSLSCHNDSECSSEHLGAEGWKCCTGAVDARPTIIYQGHCIPPHWVCGAPELFTTWGPTPSTPQFLAPSDFKNLKTTLELRANSTVVMTNTSNGITGGPFDGCVRTDKELGMYSATIKRTLAGGAAGRISFDWKNEESTLTNCTAPDTRSTVTRDSFLKDVDNQGWSISTSPAGNVLKFEELNTKTVWAFWGSWPAAK